MHLYRIKYFCTNSAIIYFHNFWVIELYSGGPSLVMKCVFVQKDEHGYGLTVSGDNPVYVQSVKPGIFQL